MNFYEVLEPFCVNKSIGYIKKDFYRTKYCLDIVTDTVGLSQTQRFRL